MSQFFPGPGPLQDEFESALEQQRSEITALNDSLTSRAIFGATLTSLVSSGEVYVRRTGNVVTLSLVNIVPSSAITTDTKIGTTPIAPMIQVFMSCKDVHNEDVFVFVLGGDIYVSGITGAKQGINFYGTVTYVTADA